MVKNNGIPIEVNNKPFEIVQEVNNEIPTFEEFMKGYENDGNLNYDDLESSDVGESKGYGPCISPNCTHSRSELQNQLREAQRELGDLQNQLSRASGSNITIIEQNITIIQVKINIIVGRIGTSQYRRFRAVFSSSFPLPRIFLTDSPRFLDVGGDTVSWVSVGSADFFLSLCGGLKGVIAGAMLPKNWTNCIVIQNIEQLRKFHDALENDIIIFANSGYLDELKEKVGELINRYERGEDISGTYSF